MSTTQKSGISLIDPEEYRPPLEFRENGLITTSFGGNLVAMCNASADGDFVAEIGGKEVLRLPVKQGKFEVRRHDFIDDNAWTTGSDLLLKLKIEINGEESAGTLYRFTRNYTREYEAYRQRDYARQRQRELLETRAGVGEVVQALARLANDNSAKKSYVTGNLSLNVLADVARGFRGIARLGEISEQEILETFFDDDALSAVKSMPNAYWFAVCVKAAVKGDKFTKISLAALLTATREVAEPIRQNVLTVAGDNAELLRAASAVEGLLLIGDGQLVANPVFATVS